MALSFEATRSREIGKIARRGGPAQVRRTYEDTPLAQFGRTFEELTRNRLTDVDVLARLRGYRDRIPFAAKRENQYFLAASIVAWHFLGEPTLEGVQGGVDEGESKAAKARAKEYHRVADPVLAQLRDILSRRAGKGKEGGATKRASKAESEARKEELTLYRGRVRGRERAGGREG